MTHGVEKLDIERQLQERIVCAIRASIACARISGFVRVDSSSCSFHVPLAFPEAPLDDALPLPPLLHFSSASSSRAASPASPAAPKVSRRKAYLPRRIAEPPQDPHSDAIAPLDPRALQESVSEALAPSLAVFPTATPELVQPAHPQPLPPQPPLLLPSEPLRQLLPKPAGRQRCRAFRAKAPGCGKRSPNKEFSCNQCRDKFRSLNSLTEHTTAVHQCFRCTTCNAKFTQRSNLQRHSLKHLGFKPFKCAICRKEYYRKDHLVRHVEVSHPGSDPKASIVNVLPSAECLRLAEEERRLREVSTAAAAAAAAEEDAVVDLSLSRHPEESGSAPSSEPMLEEEEGLRGREELEEVMEEEEEEKEELEEEEEATDLSLGGQMTTPFMLHMPALGR